MKYIVKFVRTLEVLACQKAGMYQVEDDSLTVDFLNPRWERVWWVLLQLTGKLERKYGYQGSFIK